MPYEIISSGTVTPFRLHALVRLVHRFQKISRKELIDLVQPLELGLENQETAKEVIKAAINCKLVIEIPSENVIQAGDNLSSLLDPKDFKARMQSSLLGQADENGPNFLLNIFTAWYFVQNENVFQFSKDFDKQFNEEVFRDDTERHFNSTKLNGWKMWASFLGLGWLNKENGIVIPDVHDRIDSLLSNILPITRKQAVTFGEFITKLTEYCPELDGGVLFKKCWQYSRQAAADRNRLSLALSTALRVLHDEEKIELIRRADAAENWQLFPASGHDISQVTHIRLGKNQHE